MKLKIYKVTKEYRQDNIIFQSTIEYYLSKEIPKMEKFCLDTLNYSVQCLGEGILLEEKEEINETT